MSAREAFASFCAELDRVAPAFGDDAKALDAPLAELRRALEASDDASELGSTLDLIEDLLEALMRAAGWPNADRGRT